MKKILFLILVTHSLASCTMEKRLHLPGYHVEWLIGKTPVVKTREVRLHDEQRIILTHDSTHAKAGTSYKSAYREFACLPQKEKTVYKLPAKNTTVFEPLARKDATHTNKLERPQNPLYTDPEKNHDLATLSFMLGISTVVLILLGFIHLQVWFFIAAAVIGIVAGILGDLALTRLKKNPDMYDGELMAKIAVGIASFYVGILIILLDRWLSVS